ncbi:MAG: hypothetical protein ACFE7E_07470 [Candidatus Hodarchaeota archaeon]
MTEEKKYTEQEYHRKMGVDLFNLVWSLLDKKDRSKEEETRMIHTAHASRFHWGEIGTPINFARGEWQISRVYSVLNRSQAAAYHGKRSLEICKKNNIGDFDLAFAYESLARAYAVGGDRSQSEKYAELAKKAAEEIKKKEDRDYFLSELRTIPRG